MATELGQHKKIMKTKVNLSSMYTLMGKYRKSYNINKHLRKYASSYDDEDFVYLVLCNLCVNALLLNKDEESLKLGRESLAVAEKAGVKRHVALAHGNIGLAQEKLGDLDGAVKSFYKSLELGEEIRDKRIINNDYCNLGRTYERKGAY